MNQRDKLVAVCGDSWFSADTAYQGKSFGELLCIKNNWELLSLARGGCSNFAISLQVDKAIELKSDFVILGTTTPDRAEFPIINAQNSFVWDKLKSFFNWKDWFTNQPEMYVKSRGISNVLHTNSLSSTHEWISNPTIISESLNNLMFINHRKLNPEQVDALRCYMLNLYDSGIKRQVDTWVISDSCRRLEQAKIPYLIFIESLYQWDFSKDIEWVSENKVVRPSKFSMWNDVPRSKYRELFHYCSETGSTIIVNYLEQRIKETLRS
jgi:hypothetical protein